MASNTLSRGPVIVLPHERLARRDAKFAKIDEAFSFREDHVLALESPLLAATSTEAMLHSQTPTLQTDLSAAHADRTTAHSSAVLETSVINKMHTGKEQLES